MVTALRLRAGSVPARNCFRDAYAQYVTRFYKGKDLFLEPDFDHADYHLDEEAWKELEAYIDKTLDTRNVKLWFGF